MKASPISYTLEPPGAGLPKGRLMIMKPVFRLLSKCVSRKSFDELYSCERQKILNLVSGLDPEVGDQQVLIPRLPGLEDSSRDWSVYMTLEHLCIVDTGVSGIISALCEGKDTGPAVKTEDVKPSPETNQKAVKAFETLTMRSTRTLGKIDDLKTQTEKEHPWFETMNAKRWHALRAVHLKIHRRQIEEILKRIEAGLLQT